MTVPKQAKPTRRRAGHEDDSAPASNRAAASLLTLASIDISPAMSGRQTIDTLTVGDYATAYQNGADLPPITAYAETPDAKRYWLADGLHRYHAKALIGCDAILANVIPGCQRDAILAACGANTTHGRRRTSADRRKAIETLLRDSEWGKRSDRWLAERANVSHDTVGEVRRALAHEITPPPAREGADGRTRKAPPPKTHEVDGRRQEAGPAPTRTTDAETRQKGALTPPPGAPDNRPAADSTGAPDLKTTPPEMVCPVRGIHLWDDGACQFCHEPAPGFERGTQTTQTADPPGQLANSPVDQTADREPAFRGYVLWDAPNRAYLSKHGKNNFTTDPEAARHLADLREASRLAADLRKQTKRHIETAAAYAPQSAAPQLANSPVDDQLHLGGAILPPPQPARPHDASTCPTCSGAGWILPAPEIPAELAAEPFPTLWAEWRADRRARKKTLTPNTAKRQLAKLAKLGHANACRSISQSLEHGWTGLFDPDDQRSRPNGHTTERFAGFNRGKEHSRPAENF